ncbi:MAM and LDL-receptor class A domain-containing protein 1 [Aplysia californica]|uniref:MAM and LDL-receptor class A domain-containing protein 1 n=1 Tax=Aplysia californica TaxID=6500 RepID=A0ABM0JHC0_APLCA|nr:MAM and LDL-receptor class A domain-containing protein 1 [Aplysia californica]
MVSIDCPFDLGTCSWSQGYGDAYDWAIVDEGQGSSDGSGTNSAIGHEKFLSLPAGTGHGPNAKADLLSPEVTQKNINMHLTLWLRLTGTPSGTLNIYVVAGTSVYPVFNRTTPTQGWEPFRITLDVDEEFYLKIEGTRGSETSGDVNLDDIQLVSGTPGQDSAYQCSFEDSGDICGFHSLPNGLQWIWSEASTTGVTDHTLGTMKGHVMRLDDVHNPYNNVAILSSSNLPPMSGCLNFWTWIESGALSVYINREDTQEELLLQRSGYQGAGWVKSEVGFSSNGVFSVNFRGKSSGVAVILLDDVSLTTGECDTRGEKTCTRQHIVGHPVQMSRKHRKQVFRREKYFFQRRMGITTKYLENVQPIPRIKKLHKKVNSVGLNTSEHQADDTLYYIC